MGSGAAERPDAGPRLAAEVELLRRISDAARSSLGEELFQVAVAEGAGTWVPGGALRC